MDRHTTQDIERQAREWLVHLLSGTADREDGEAFRRWCQHSEAHAAAFVRTRRLWEQMGPALDLQRDVSARRRPDRTHGARMTRRAFLGAAVAAGVVGVVGVRFAMMGSTGGGAVLTTGIGEQRTVAALPGVSVELNTATALSIDGHAVQLRHGEAVVQVDRRRVDAFMLAVGGGQVLAFPGASFAARCDDSGASVTCLDGATRLIAAGSRVDIKPSQRVTFTDIAVDAPEAINAGNAFAWRDRVLVYDNQPLGDVVADINRYRPGRIVIMDRTLAERRVHARFTLDQMGEVATLIEDTYGAHATHLPGGWVLLS
jgi:transmembrane sensor